MKPITYRIVMQNLIIKIFFFFFFEILSTFGKKRITPPIPNVHE